ncbi:MAG TPA: sugar phosphate isomerase/epimerase [Pyrinomonadaceae bacterium]|jgi:Sugar phosphate isomerases/epimerases|nr:sugar phosphate isomerase/epimerase [Pyrinomonadaceae bacterium]
MKLALNGATTMRADLATDLRVAEIASFDYLEIWASKLRDYLKDNSTADLKSLFAQHHLQPLSINSIEHITFQDSVAYESIKQQCRELSQIASEIGCTYVVVVPGRIPAGGATPFEVMEESVRVLDELCNIAKKFDVSLAFEFLGQSDCSVQTLDLAHEIVRIADRKNLGLVIDSFHFYAGGSTIEMIEALDPRLLFVFHINDAEDRPREELNDSHRLLPGLGILPLRAIVAALGRIGYDSVASVEIFRPQYWEMDPVELAKQAYTATTEVLSTARQNLAARIN